LLMSRGGGWEGQPGGAACLAGQQPEAWYLQVLSWLISGMPMSCC